MPLKLKLSATALGKSACTLNLYRTVVDGYKEQFKPAKLVYGIAIHKFREVMYKTGGNTGAAFTAAKKAFDLPKIDDKKSPHLSDQKHLITTCANYWSMYVEEDSTFSLIEIDGKPLVEQTFSIDSFYKDDIIDVDIQGTLDGVGQIKGGCYCIPDLKTTSTWDTKRYWEQYELSRQLKLYRLASMHYAKQYPDSTLGRIGKTHMGCFIDAIFIKPDANNNEYERSDVFQYTDEEMFEFEKSLKFYCKSLSFKIRNEVHLDKEGILNGSCWGRYGQCSFWNVCKSPDNIAKILLERDFVKVPWNPQDYNDLNKDLEV